MQPMAMQGTRGVQLAIFGRFILPLMKLGSGAMRSILKRENGLPYVLLGNWKVLPLWMGHRASLLLPNPINRGGILGAKVDWIM